MGKEVITGNEACKILKTTSRNLRELYEQGLIKAVQISPNRKGYYLEEIQNISKKKDSISIFNKKSSSISPKNSLNDLNGTQWLPETKSFVFQHGLGSASKEAQIEKLHPAPFSFQDIEKLITFFTKKGATVLDPFGGVGSTAKACEKTHRKCISIELSKKYHNLSIKRLETEVGKGTSKHHLFINGDSVKELKKLKPNSIDFMVTSPPYWFILNKKLDYKTIKRANLNLDTNYSNSKKDLGNIKDYNEFLDILVNEIFIRCAELLKLNKYMVIIVSDFRNKSEYVSFHSDLIVKMRNFKLKDGSILRLQGTKILLQNHKSLLPYGYPYAYVENIHHQYMLIFRKESH